MKRSIISFTHFLLFGLLLMSISQSQAAPFSPAYEASTQAYAGEEYFRAIMFGQGNLARKIPQHRAAGIDSLILTLTPRQKRSVRALQDRIIQTIAKQKGAKYFATFKSVMTSGNRPRIKTMLNQK